MTDIAPTEALTELLEAGVHFGHQTKRWNPKMKPFIFEKRNAIHVVDLTKTVEQLEAAQQFLSQVARDKGKVLFVGCKKQAQEAVKEAAIAAGHYYVNQRWLGGTLTNLQTIRRSIQRLKYIEGLDSSPDAKKMGKQEISALKREGAKLTRNLRRYRKSGALSTRSSCRHRARIERRGRGRAPEHPDRGHRGHERGSDGHHLPGGRK